ncbi:11519_t:CDS:2, partial [Cetraspora pellucida]
CPPPDVAHHQTLPTTRHCPPPDVMSQSDVNENYIEIDSQEEASSDLFFQQSSQNEVNEVASIETPSDLFSQQMPAISITRNGISKRRLYKTLSIPSIAFEQALNLYDKKLDKNEGVYKYVFECQHAGSPQTKKKAIEPSQQCNRKSIKTNCTCFINICWLLSSPGPSITKLNLTHYGHTPCPNSAHFSNTYRQLPQNIIDKEFNARMSSTQRNMLASELQKAKYRDYLESLSYSVGSSASSRVFSKLVEYLKSVLTNEIFQIQKAQIDICFEYNSLPILFKQFSIHDNVDAIDTIACIEDHSDRRQVAFKSLIKHVDPNNIIGIWEVKHMGADTISMNCIVLLKDQSHVCTCLLLFSEEFNDVDSLKVNTLFDNCNISSSEEFFITDDVQTSFSTMNMIQDLRKDDLGGDYKEIEYKILKQQIYGKCAALGRKLAALASKFILTHISATLRGLIQQVEQANSSSLNSPNSNTIQNPFQVNARERPAKRIKSSTETNVAQHSQSKTANAKTHSGDTYTCQNCFKDGHNAKSCVVLCRTCNKNGHTYLNCLNKENV